MAFTNPPFVVELTSAPTSTDAILAAVVRVAPLLVAVKHLDAVLPSLPPTAEYWISAQGETEAAVSQALDKGAAQVLADGTLQGVPEERVVKSGKVKVVRLEDLSSPDDVAKLALAPLRSDRPDKLFSTSVASVAPCSTLLGQVFSSPESLARSIVTGEATYFSRSRNQLWVKGATSGATQEVARIRFDCDHDAVEFQVRQKQGTGFCHTGASSCFGPVGGLAALEQTLLSRKASAPEGSYTQRLFNDEKLLRAKILEEASELGEAQTPEDVAAEMADVVYFALARCVSKGVGWEQVERVLDARAKKLTRRKGDAKPQWEEKIAALAGTSTAGTNGTPAPASQNLKQTTAPTNAPETANDPNAPIKCRTFDLAKMSPAERPDLLKRPLVDSTAMISRVTPIISRVRTGGDKGLLSCVKEFDRCSVLDTPVLRAPFAPELMAIPDDVKAAIDQAYANVHLFHLRQLDKEREPMVVETMPGVVCSRFARPIDRVGLYVPGGSAVLPSTALMLAIPAQVAGCTHVSIASPPRPDGSISPEIIYIASRCGVHEIVKAGGAHAVAALAYGTETVTKVDKIFGPGNQYVTAAKVAVASDTGAAVAIDMPAGPSEVLVIADETAVASHVAADLLSQAEHGPDSQVVLLAVQLSPALLADIEKEIDAQARALPRCDITRQAIAKSLIVKVASTEEAFELSNDYAPEHLILHLKDASKLLAKVRNAGSVFVGPYSPESCGDYASGTNQCVSPSSPSPSSL